MRGGMERIDRCWKVIRRSQRVSRPNCDCSTMFVDYIFKE